MDQDEALRAEIADLKRQHALMNEAISMNCLRAEKAERERDAVRYGNAEARKMAVDLAVNQAVDAALQEVARQGGPDYLLVEAKNSGLGAAAATETSAYAVMDKLASVIGELKEALSERDEANRRLRTATASRDDVWFWQGDGDDPGSLSCPVVMSSQTLRDLLLMAEPADMERTKAARDVLRGKLGRQDWLLSVGVAVAASGPYHIQVNVVEDGEQVRKAVPKHVDGVRVEVEAVGSTSLR